MSAPEAIPPVSSAISQEVSKGIQDIRNFATCKICTRLMYEPYTTQCGHSFCYECLSKWVNRDPRKRQCPDCRAKIKDEPSPNYTIRGIVQVLISNSAFIDEDETPDTLQTEQSQAANEVELDKSGQAGLFRGAFKTRLYDLIQDTSDRVMRCPRCNWEVEDGYCIQCNVDFGDGFASWSTDEYDSEMDPYDEDDIETVDTDEPDSEDAAFIDDETVNDNMVGRGIPHYSIENEEGGHASSDSFDSLDIHRWRLEQARGERSRSEDEAGGSEAEVIDGDGDTEAESRSGHSSSGNYSDTSERDTEEQSPSDPEPESIARPSERHVRRSISDTNPQGHREGPDLVSLMLGGGSNPSSSRQGQNHSRHATGASNMGSTTGPASRNKIQDIQQISDDESGTDTPLPVRPRKRVRIVVSDDESDNDSDDVQEDSRTRRRRLNRQHLASAR